VYYPDGALHLNLPPRQSFSKDAASPLVKSIIKAALDMLVNEQKRVKKGGKEQAKVFVQQLAGTLPHRWLCGFLTMIPSTHVSRGTI
jgi:hypothetical protein